MITGEQMETCAWRSPATLKPTSSAEENAPQILLLKFCRNHERSETAWTAKTNGGDCVSHAA